MADDAPLRPLTTRQQQVAALAGRGLSCKQIAAQMARSGTRISVGRVRNVVYDIAILLPNPDGLGSLRLVQLWAAHRTWLTNRKAAS